MTGSRLGRDVVSAAHLSAGEVGVLFKHAARAQGGARPRPALANPPLDRPTLAMSDPREAVDWAAIVYADDWTSMGQEAEERLDAFAPCQVDEALLAATPDAVVMHGPPAHRGAEIMSDVMDGRRSIIFLQSENRLHAQHALLVELLAG